MEKQNVQIADKRTVGIQITLCAASTHSFSCLAYPVFSQATNDGTTFYFANSPLKQLSPPGPHKSKTFPACTYSPATGTALITFDYGLTFDATNPEYAAASSPRRYKYLLATSNYAPGNLWDPVYTANCSVVMYGQVDVFVPVTHVSSCFSVCSIRAV